MHTHPFTLQQIPHKGLGYIANRLIHTGEVILEETSLRSRSFQTAEAPIESGLDLAQQLLSRPELSLYCQEVHVGEVGIAKALAQVKSNAFISQEEHQGELKFFLQLDPMGSFFNHSCWPNVATHLRMDGVSITVAIEEIQKGEELCLCYKSWVLFLPAHRRKELLKANWGFDCGCERCKNERKNDTLLTSSQAHMSKNEVEEMKKLFDELMSTKDGINDERSAKNWVRKAISFTKLGLHPTHWRNIEIRQHLIHFTMNPIFNQTTAKQILEQQVDAYKMIVPKYHNIKLELYMVYRHVRNVNMKIEDKEVEKELQRMDDAYETVLHLFKK